MKRGFISVALLALLVTACGGQAASSGQATSGSASSAANKSPIVFGDLATLSTSAAVTGKEEEVGRQMAAADINAAGGVNGHPVKLVTEDAGFDNQKAINALQKVMGSHPSAILAPVFSNLALALEPQLLKDKVPMLYAGSAGEVTKQGNPWFFRDMTDVSYAEPKLASWYLGQVKATKPAIIYSNDAFGISLKNAVVQGLKQDGITPVTIQSFDDSASDVSAQVTAVKQSGADALFVEAVSSTGAIVLKTLYQQGVSIPTMVANPILATSVLKLIPAAALKGVYVNADYAPTYSNNPAVQKWVARFEKKYNYTPSWAEAINYAAVKMLAAVVQKYGSSPSEVQQGLKKIQYHSIFGTFYSDSEGNLWHADDVLRFGTNKQATLVKSIKVTP